MFNRPDIVARRSIAEETWTIALAGLELLICYAFLGFFALYLTLPLVQALYPLAQTVYPRFATIMRPLDERRQPSSFPSLSLLLGTDGGFAIGLNKWFDDRVGFRDLFIRSKNHIDYTLFRTSRKIYIGHEGWLFDIHDPPMSVDRLAALKTSFVALVQALHRKGVQLIVVGYPDKAEIYAEKAPPQLPRRPKSGNYEKLRGFLTARADLMFIDAEEILKREKGITSERLYAKTDLHATQVGQLSVVKEIIRRIAQAEGRPEIHWAENFRLAHGPMGPGSAARFLSLLSPPIIEKEYPYFEGTYTVGGEEPDGRWFLATPNLGIADDGIGRPFDYEFSSSPQACKQQLPSVVLFGNSFSDFYWPLGLHRYFCSIRRARDPITRLKAFYETMPADTKYFIFQYYEPTLATIPVMQ